MSMIRASQSAILLVLMLVIVGSGCGDPGEPSPDIALSRAADGRLMLVYRLCPHVRPREIAVGNGLDRWAEPALRLSFKHAPVGVVTIDLASPDPQTFEVKRAQIALEMDVPLFARVSSSAGTQAQLFDADPPDGLVRYEPLGSRKPENVSLERFKSSPPQECS